MSSNKNIFKNLLKCNLKSLLQWKTILVLMVVIACIAFYNSLLLNDEALFSGQVYMVWDFVVTTFTFINKDSIAWFEKLKILVPYIVLTNIIGSIIEEAYKNRFYGFLIRIKSRKIWHISLIVLLIIEIVLFFTICHCTVFLIGLMKYHVQFNGMFKIMQLFILQVVVSSLIAILQYFLTVKINKQSFIYIAIIYSIIIFCI